MPGWPQHMEVLRGKLCVGYPSGFRMWDLVDNAQSALLSLEDTTLQFLNQSCYDAHLIVEVTPEKEFLLVFDKLGVYVDCQGRRSRTQELMFPARPCGFRYFPPYLCVYSDTHIDVFNVHSADWVQTLNLKKAHPLTKDGSLSVCYVADMPYIVLLSDVISDEDAIQVPTVPFVGQDRVGPKVVGRNKKRKFSFRSVKVEEKMGKAGHRLSSAALPISGPSDFVHITHMGPGDGIEFQKLVDLKVSPDCGRPGHQGAGAKVKQMLMGPMIRSASSTGAPPSAANYAKRPLSSQSKSSDGSSLGRDGSVAVSHSVPLPHDTPTCSDGHHHHHQMAAIQLEQSPRNSMASVSSGSSPSNSNSPAAGAQQGQGASPPKRRTQAKSQVV